MFHLLLHEFLLFGLQQLLGNTLGIFLATQAEGPQLFTELGGVLIKEPCEIDLKRLDVWLFKGKLLTLARARLME